MLNKNGLAESQRINKKILFLDLQNSNNREIDKPNSPRIKVVEEYMKYKINQKNKKLTPFQLFEKEKKLFNSMINKRKFKNLYYENYYDSHSNNESLQYFSTKNKSKKRIIFKKFSPIQKNENHTERKTNHFPKNDINNKKNVPKKKGEIKTVNMSTQTTKIKNNKFISTNRLLDGYKLPIIKIAQRKNTLMDIVNNNDNISKLEIKKINSNEIEGFSEFRKKFSESKRIIKNKIKEILILKKFQ